MAPSRSLHSSLELETLKSAQMFHFSALRARLASNLIFFTLKSRTYMGRSTMVIEGLHQEKYGPSLVLASQVTL
jgi:hypothetical protein